MVKNTLPLSLSFSSSFSSSLPLECPSVGNEETKLAARGNFGHCMRRQRCSETELEMTLTSQWRRKERRLARGPGHPGARPQEQMPILAMSLFDIVTDQSKVSLLSLLGWRCGAVKSLGGSEVCDGILPLLSVIAHAHLLHTPFTTLSRFCPAVTWHGRLPQQFLLPCQLARFQPTGPNKYVFLTNYLVS